MSDLTELLELNERVIPPDFDEIIAVRRTRSRRAHAATAFGLTAAGIVAIVGALSLTGGNDKTEPAPTTPTPTPSELFVIPDGQTTIAADIRPGDIHGLDVLATVTNTQQEHRGATDLSTTVTVNSEGRGGQSPVILFCRNTNDENIWLVRTESLGAGGYGPCLEHPKSFQTIDVPQYLDPGEPEQLTVRVYLTRATPELKTCLDHGNGDVNNCFALYGQPLATTDAEFGFRIYEHQATRKVLTLWGEQGLSFEALSSIDGKPWIVDRAVVAASGAPRLAVALPDSHVSRIVGVYSERGAHWDACVKEHEAELPTPEGLSPWRQAVEEACGGFEFRLLVDGEYVEGATRKEIPDSLGAPVMYVAPGAHNVAVEVTGNDPRNVRFAVVIRKEQAQ